MSAWPTGGEGFALRPGELYRISYAVGGVQQRRVTRSLAVFVSRSERRQWNGDVVDCLDFSRPQGRPLSLLASQLVDVRPASLDERGRLVLLNGGTHRRRLSRRRSALQT
jgi:hypothetical protein